MAMPARPPRQLSSGRASSSEWGSPPPPPPPGSFVTVEATADAGRGGPPDRRVYRVQSINPSNVATLTGVGEGVRVLHCDALRRFRATLFECDAHPELLFRQVGAEEGHAQAHFAACQHARKVAIAPSALRAVVPMDARAMVQYNYAVEHGHASHRVQELLSDHDLRQVGAMEAADVYPLLELAQAQIDKTVGVLAQLCARDASTRGMPWDEALRRLRDAHALAMRGAGGAGERRQPELRVVGEGVAERLVQPEHLASIAHMHTGGRVPLAFVGQLMLLHYTFPCNLARVRLDGGRRVVATARSGVGTMLTLCPAAVLVHAREDGGLSVSAEEKALPAAWAKAARARSAALRSLIAPFQFPVYVDGIRLQGASPPGQVTHDGGDAWLGHMVRRDARRANATYVCGLRQLYTGVVATAPIVAGAEVVVRP